jgi:hypothetical protein
VNKDPPQSEKEVTVSPHAKDMTDKQRRWWFAHLDEEKTSQKPGTEPPRRSKYLTEAQRRRLEERKEAALGRMHGWAYVSGKTVEYQPRDTLEHHYEQGFKEGVTDAGEWITGMWGLAEMLGEIVRKVSNALAEYLKPPDIPKPWDIELFPQLPGTINTQQQRDKAIRSLEKRIQEHEQKLSDYMKDPYAHDNKGHLRNAKDPVLREKIYEERIDSLKHQIENFKGEIDELKRWRP